MNGYDNWKLSGPETTYRDEDNERTVTLLLTDTVEEETYEKQFVMFLGAFDAKQFDDDDLPTEFIIEYLYDEIEEEWGDLKHTDKLEVIW